MSCHRSLNIWPVYCILAYFSLCALKKHYRFSTEYEIWDIPFRFMRLQSLSPCVKLRWHWSPVWLWSLSVCALSFDGSRQPSPGPWLMAQMWPMPGRWLVNRLAGPDGVRVYDQRFIGGTLLGHTYCICDSKIQLLIVPLLVFVLQSSFTPKGKKKSNSMVWLCFFSFNIYFCFFPLHFTHIMTSSVRQHSQEDNLEKGHPS